MRDPCLLILYKQAMPFTVDHYISFLIAVILFMLEQDNYNNIYVNTESGPRYECWDFLHVSKVSFSISWYYPYQEIADLLLFRKNNSSSDRRTKKLDGLVLLEIR